MSLPLTPSAFDSPELTNANKWWLRVLQPISAKIATYLGDGAWTDATLLNGFTAYQPATYGNPGYRVRDGILHLRGAVAAGGAVTSTIFTLPVGYRPVTPHIFHANCTNGNGRIDVRDTGAVNLVMLAATAPVGGRTFMFLDGIHLPLSA